MNLTINGKDMELPEAMTITAFLDDKNLQPRSVVVEVNRVIIERENFTSHILQDGDEVEIMRFIGGG
jgi:sulfur carrier protein